MTRLQIANYSRFFDPSTRTEFHSVLDLRDGCHKGVALVSQEVAQVLLLRQGFSLVSDEEWLAMTTHPAPPDQPVSTTGDPLAEVAGATGEAMTGAPQPPAGGTRRTR